VLREEGLPLEQAILTGADQRLRPILMTTIVAFFGLLPASPATGLGSHVQRPPATVTCFNAASQATASRKPRRGRLLSTQRWHLPKNR